MISFDCSACGAHITVKDEAAGKKVKCPKCGAVVQVPRPTAPVLEKSGPPSIPAGRDFGALPSRPSPPAKRRNPPSSQGHTCEPVSRSGTSPAIPDSGTQPAPVQAEVVTFPQTEVLYPSVVDAQRLHQHQVPAAQVSPGTTVQVNVQASHAALVLGVSSLVVGSLSFFVCWMPYIGAFIAALGLLLGVAGLLMSVMRKEKGIGFSVAGTGVSACSFILALASTLFFHGAASSVNQAVNRIDPETKVVLTPPVAQAKADLAPFRYSPEYQRLRLLIQEQLPLNPIVTGESVAIDQRSHIPLNMGIVESIGLSELAGRPACKLHLRNPTQDKVKPDLRVLLLNQDGVIVLQHNENWVMDTLDYNQSRDVQAGRTRFPECLVFSRWALLGWDTKPEYVLCVGSKTSYDKLKQRLEEELQKVRALPSEVLNYPYDIKTLLPEAIPLLFEQTIQIPNSTIVESILFSNRVTISYRNKSDMRIKPNIMAYVLNKDGVIIGSFRDSWSFQSLAPGQQEQVETSVYLHVPDELVFSRWAPFAYDKKPAWLLVAGSSKAFDELVERTTNTVRSLNAASITAR